MKEGCELILEKTTYAPGEVVEAKLQCTYFSEHKVKSVRVIFSGEVKVSWSEGKYVSYEDEHQVLKSDVVLVEGETVFQPGTYNYQVVFALPGDLPSSLEAKHGHVKYKAEAVISRPWAIDYNSKKSFAEAQILLQCLQNVVKATQEKTPMRFFKPSGPITVAVELPQSAYAQGETISFVANLKNDSSVIVKELRFQIVQGYEFHVGKKTIEQIVCAGQDFAVANSSVPGGTSDSWNLELKVPADMPIALMGNCELITAFWKLRGEARLPFPHNNVTIDVPITLGAHDDP
ncbi:hypothetical protein FQR65_LT12407 [Abscondita terminalis]|nr:hypothetical protein FQR65_LT12407 [Abscondita terminalis]